MNSLTIAVAGARKTQGIIEACAMADEGRRILVLAYTTASQSEIERRLAIAAPFKPNVEVLGWYSFLLRHFVRPYLPLLFPGHALHGFNFDGDPGIYATGAARYMDSEGRAYQRHLAALAHKVHEASGGSVVDRLEHIYTDVYIDEAQDIGGWSLEILDVLFASKIEVHLVGDMRQALLSTDPRDTKNSAFKGDKVLHWYRHREGKGLVAIEQNNVTHRSNQEIATFSDSIFSPALGFSATESASTETHDHCGLFRVTPTDAAAYIEAHSALALHWRADLGQSLDVAFTTFGVAKGCTVEHVIILPTQKLKTLLERGTPLDGKTACSFYIGVTRAKHSVAFILEASAVAPALKQWSP